MKGIFFHYFKGDGHIDCQGALSQEKFEKMILYLKSKYKILDAKEFYDKCINGETDENAICLCFNCGLRSQYDIALPILEKYNIKAFFMLYTKMITEQYVEIEVYHHFRFYAYKSIDEYYADFFEMAKKEFGDNWESIIAAFEEEGYLKWASYYTYQDRLHKYIRDRISKDIYDKIIQRMMELKRYSPREHRPLMWISEEKIKKLSNDGHMIGLHTHSHPYDIGSLSYEEQLKEYKTNKDVLEKIINKRIVSMSHPCNSYNQTTLRVLNELNIKIGFRANDDGMIRSNLELPSIDHATILKELKELP